MFRGMWDRRIIRIVCIWLCCFFFQAEDGIRDYKVTGVQTCALPISSGKLRMVGAKDRKAQITRQNGSALGEAGRTSSAKLSQRSSRMTGASRSGRRRRDRKSVV